MRDPFPNIPHNCFGWAILLGLSAAGLALACSCVSYEPVQACQIFHSTPVIFRGRVIDHNDDRTGGFVQLTLYRFEVFEIFKGLPPATKEVFIDPASLTSCYRVYETNRDYLIYTGGAQPAQVAAPFLSSQRLIQTKQIPAAWRNLGGLPVFMVGGCNPSRIVDENDADLAYLRSTLTRGPQTNGWIDGRAVQHFAWSGRTRAFPGLSGATFIFKSPSGIQASASTQNDGAFRLDEIPSGTYSVSAEHHCSAQEN